MAVLRPLSSKDVRELCDTLHKQFGTAFDTSLVWYLHTKHDDLYLVSGCVRTVSFDTLRVNNMGLYVAHIMPDKTIRLSVEGSQLLGKTATRNVVDITQQQAAAWMNGEHISCDASIEGFVIVRYGSDYLGSGKARSGELINFVPKSRRCQVIT